MNRLAVALAADSAATVTAVQGNKIFNSADKLFMLSRRQPVGIMIYGSASLLGVPWETIIKMFRRKLGPSEYPKLEDYGKALLGHLNQNQRLFPADAQDEHFNNMLRNVLGPLSTAIQKKLWQDIFENGTKLSAEETRAFATEQILELRDRWKTFTDAKCFQSDEPRAVLTRHSGKVNEMFAELFGDMSLGRDGMDALHELAYLLMVKDAYSPECTSGVVIAGFGEEEHFPVMQAYNLGGIYEGTLKYQLAKTSTVNTTTPSHVVPFAQTEMVDTFLTGMNPQFERQLWTNVVSLIQRMPEVIVNEIGVLRPEEKVALIGKLKPAALKSALHIVQQLRSFRDEQHLQPILQAIMHCPKDQLAHIASSLVNLNSFQKRMSMKPETVGGPVDVAVISKGDGFIWIERKHYFRPELNPHFFRNFGKDGAGGTQPHEHTESEAGLAGVEDTAGSAS